MLNNISFKLFLLCVLFLFAIEQSRANQTVKSVSKGGYVKVKAKQTANDSQSKSRVNKQLNTSKKVQLTGKSRQQVQQLKRVNKTQTTTANTDYSFEIYSAESFLLTDIDQDGYFQAFSVSFDADLYSSYPDDQASVYADLYISQNGSPWTLYYSTDNFIITGDSNEDEYEVETELSTGYPTDNYDILIDLLDSESDEILASYSADDSNALYALPLESADYDPEYVIEEEVVVVEEGGSLNFLIVLLMLTLVVIRYHKNLTIHNASFVNKSTHPSVKIKNK